MPDMTNESVTVRLSEWHRLQDENRVAVERVAVLEAVLRIIAGREQCVDNLMSNAEIAAAALDKL